MKWIHRFSLFLAVVFLAGCATMGSDAVQVRMTGAEEVPPATTSASGSGSVTVGADGSVTGSFKTQGAAITAAHIHDAPAGSNGKVIIPLEKTGENDWVVPAGAKLTEAQQKSYKDGNLYVNFHSAKFKGGEIRAQIRPGSGGGRTSGY